MAIIPTPNRAYPYPDYAQTANFPLQIQNFATAVDTDVQALANAVATAKNRPGVRASGVPAQAVPTGGGGAAATFDTEDYDNGGFFTLGAPDRFTITTTGLYLVAFRCTFASNDTGVRNAYLEQNLAAVINGVTQTAGAAGGVTGSFTALLDFIVGDVIRFILRQDSGAPLNVTTKRAALSLVTV